MKKTPLSLKSAASERGSALIYILIAIALLGALTVSFMEPSSQQTSSQNSFKTVAGLQGQVEFIRSAIQECILRYSAGDNTINGSSTTDADHNIPFPLKPNSTHFTGATIGPTTGTRLVKDIRCPGNPGNNQNHAKIFGGTTGKFMPPAPDLFEPWQYYNGEDGVFFWIQTSKTDAFLASALDKMDDNFGECEADVIDATGSAVDLDSNSDIECASGYTCFRIWMVANATASGPHQDAGCP